MRKQSTTSHNRVIIAPDPIIVELATALGLPKGTTGFTLRAKINEPVTLECKYFVEGGTDQRHYKVDHRREAGTLHALLCGG